MLVPKTDGSVSFCTDFQCLSDVYTFDAHLIPKVDTLLEPIGTAQYSSTIDLNKSYWQISLGPENKQKTISATTRGLYHFTDIPFGLHGAAFSFWRVRDNALAPVQDCAMVLHINDIWVFSPTWEAYVKHVQ